MRPCKGKKKIAAQCIFTEGKLGQMVSFGKLHHTSGKLKRKECTIINSHATIFCYCLHWVESAEQNLKLIGNVKIWVEKRKAEGKGAKCSVTKDFSVIFAGTHFPHHDQELLSIDPAMIFIPNCYWSEACSPLDGTCHGSEFFLDWNQIWIHPRHILSQLHSCSDSLFQLNWRW